MRELYVLINLPSQVLTRRSLVALTAYGPIGARSLPADPRAKADRGLKQTHDARGVGREKAHRALYPYKTRTMHPTFVHYLLTYLLILADTANLLSSLFSLLFPTYLLTTSAP